MILNRFVCDQTSSEIITSFFTQEAEKTFSNILINGHIFQENVIAEEVDVVFRLVAKSWSEIQSVMLYDATISHIELINHRALINQSLTAILKCLKSCDSHVIKSRYIDMIMRHTQRFSSLVLPFLELENEINVKLTITAFHNEKAPLYQYFHTFLDVQYYLLLIEYVCGKDEELKLQLHSSTQHLITLSRKLYKQQHNHSFVCSCIKYLWLVIEIICEKAFEEDYFWKIFNNSVDHLEGDFVLWLVKDIAAVQGIDYTESSLERIKPNFPILESSLKNILNKGEVKCLTDNLRYMEPLICKLWLKSGKIEIYQMLWEYFSKRLNISHRKDLHYSSTELNELLDGILWSPNQCNGEFELFVGMLIKHLDEHPQHWGKMKGRIYSQLSPNKIKDLNNVGIFHVLMLFIALTRINFEEMSKKFINFMDSLPAEKKRNSLVWQLYGLLIMRFVRENRTVEDIAPPLVQLLDEAVVNQNCFHLIKTFIQDFQLIVNISTNFQLHQWLFLNNWIHKYSQKCSYPDLQSFLEVMLNTLEKVHSAQAWCDWEMSFKNHIYQVLKHVCTSTTVPEVAAVLAARIATSSPELFGDAFTFFNSHLIITKISSNFLSTTLEKYPTIILTPHQESVALQTWVRTCLLTKDNHEELTKKVVKLDIVPNCIKTELKNVRDPLCALIDCLGSNIEQYRQNSSVNKLCSTGFEQADRWITQYSSNPENEAIVLRSYTCVALAFYKIGPLLYNRHKANSAYVSLVNAMLLPSDVLVGRPLHPFILSAVKKTWALFYESAVKLNSPQDTFIERILKDLVVKYVPYFTIADSPMLKCLDNEKLAEIILDKMSSAFFKHPTKEAESSIFKSLRIIDDYIQSTTSTNALKLIVTKALFGLFEIIMFHNQKHVAHGVVKNLISSPLYLNVKNDFEETLDLVMKKHLAFNTSNFFQLMGLLTKLISNDLTKFIPKLRQHISHVEKMRGVGFDKSLRLNLERLEASLL